MSLLTPIPPPDIEKTSPKEYKIPLALLGFGVLTYLGASLIVGGINGLVSMLIHLPIRLVVQVFLGVIACFLTAKIMGTAFGSAASAVVKLAAIFIFPTAVSFFLPWWIGWLISLLLYWRLLEYLFELEAMETIALVVVIFLVNAGAIFLLSAIAMGLTM